MKESSARIPQVGDVVAGKYELVAAIGRGGMGLVFRAMHRGLGRSFALKVLHPDTAADPELRHRFEREARILAQIRASHVVSVADVDVLPDGLPYMVLEHLVGNDLEAELEAYGGRPLPIGDAVDYVHQAALGMIEAHANGVVHRDLKPSNIFLVDLQPALARRLVKIVDFGISKIQADDGRRTATQSSFGTPLYMSPEQIRSASNVDERTDVWSLGAILFEVLIGSPPFLRDSPSAVFAAVIADPLPDPRTLRPDLPSEFDAILRRALEKDVNRRYPTMRAFADALLPFAPRERMSRVAASIRAPSFDSLRVVTPPLGTVAPAGRALTETGDRPNATTFLQASSVPSVESSQARSPRVPPRRAHTAVAVVAGLAAAGAVVVAGFAFRASPRPNEHESARATGPSAPSSQASVRLTPTEPIAVIPSMTPLMTPSATTADSSSTTPMTPAPSLSVAPRNRPSTSASPSTSARSATVPTAPRRPSPTLDPLAP